MHLFCISKDDLHLAPECLNWGGGWWGGEGGGGGGGRKAYTCICFVCERKKIF